VISYSQSKTNIFNRYIKFCYDFVPYIVIQSRNINQRNAHFSN